MNAKDDAIVSSVEGTGAQRRYHVGTLTYGRVGLAMLFFWLLWGDFCYVLMESVTPSIVPVKFQNLGASNLEVGLLLGTIPGMVYSVLNPIASFKSDRFRSRWGRRIPFIMGTLPFLVACLVALAYADQLGFWLHHHLGASVEKMTPETVAIFTIGFFNVAYTFFNSFLTSVFWYLFNDVVPEHLLARFMSLFRMVSMAAGAIYNFCIFRYADSNSTAILLGAAVLYGVGFTAMCIFVREGEYPPPPPYIGGQTGIVAALKTYGVECHFTAHYWYQWLSTVIGSIGGAAGSIGTGTITAFGLFFYSAIGLSKAEIGDVYGAVLITSGILIPVSGWLADKYHPIRVVIVAATLNLFVMLPLNVLWLFWHPGHELAFYFCMAMAILIMAPANALGGVYDPPLFMRLFPRSRYGQFCSTNAIWRSIGGIIGGGLAGWFLDFVASYVGKQQAYFFIPLWQILFTIPPFYFLLKLYQSWKKHGGDDAYLPPVLSARIDPSIA